jgi:ferredoxin
MREMKISVDENLCVGHGRCYALAPDVFGADDFGHCEILNESPEGALAEQARLGAENCPERAITIDES